MLACDDVERLELAEVLLTDETTVLEVIGLVLACDDVEKLELAEVLLATETTALEVTELVDELWLAEVLSDELLEALFAEIEELVKLLVSEDDAEGLMLDEEP